MEEKNLFLNRELLATKISDLEKSLSFLHNIAQTTSDQFLANPILVSGTKYQLIIAIEAAQSICNHLAARVAREAPQSYAECFRILGENGIIAKKLAGQLASMAKFRNLLVHGYGNIDDSIVHSILNNDILDLTKYIEEIKLFLRQTGGAGS